VWVASSLLKKPHIINAIPKYFSEMQFGIIRIVFAGVVASHFFISYWLLKRWAFITSGLVAGVGALRSALYVFWILAKPYDKWEKIMFWLIIFIPFFVAAYNIFSIPISYDESVSYIDFISKGPVVIGSLFHTTNNHVLYNYIGYVCCLFFKDSEIVQRLPLLFIYLTSSILLFALLKKMVKPYAALIGLSFYVLSSPVYLYSFMARGYLLILLFVLLALWSSYNLLTSSGKRYWVGLYLSSVLGMYTIPVMAYLLVPLYIFLGFFFLWKNKMRVMALIKTAMFSVLTLSLFYMPIILVSGLGALFQVINETGTKANVFTNMVGNSKMFSDFYISSNTYFKAILSIIVLAGVAIALYYSRGRNRIFIFFLAAISILPLLLTTTLSQRMFDRTWIYVIVPFSIFYSFAFNWVKKRELAFVIFSFTLLIQFISSKSNVYFSDQKHQMYVARKASDKFVSGKMHSIYINHLYVRPMIEYRLMILNYKYDLNIGSSVFRNVPFDKSKKYDMIVCTDYNKQASFYKNYTLTDSIKEIRVFQRFRE
jgi:hypothetical protein